MIRLFSVMSNGRGAAAAGTFITADARSAQAQSRDYQIQIALTGSTALRPKAGDPDFPSNPQGGIFYVDTTLSKVIVSDGVGNWRDPISGAVV